MTSSSPSICSVGRRSDSRLGHTTWVSGGIDHAHDRVDSTLYTSWSIHFCIILCSTEQLPSIRVGELRPLAEREPPLLDAVLPKHPCNVVLNATVMATHSGLPTVARMDPTADKT